MKLIVAIVECEDAAVISQELSKNGYPFTSTKGVGGFLKTDKDILLSGVDDMRVRDILSIIEKFSHSRELDVPEIDVKNIYTLPGKVHVGGAQVFVLDVDRFYKL